MHSIPRTRALITAVAARVWLARFGGVAGRGLVLTAAVAFAVVVAARLTGLPGAWTHWTVLALPALVALVAGLVAARRPGPVETARLLDERLERVDLFRTCLELDRAPGAYQAVVQEQAEAAAAGCEARRIVPYAPRPLLGRAAVALAALALAIAVVPVLDPFGAHAARERLEKRQQLLKTQQQEAKERLARLQEEKPEQPVSDAVARELAQLTTMFDALKPGQPQENQAPLAKELRDLAKALADHQTAAFKPENAEQLLGGGDIAKALAEALAKGEERRIAEEAGEVQKLAQALASQTDPVKAEQQRRDLQRRLEGLQQALGRRGAAAGRTVQQALDQLAAAGDARTRDQALEALESSLEQLGAELQCLGREARDVEALKQALSACRLAKGLNDKNALPGDCKGLSLAEYAKRYGQCMGSRSGSGGKGGQGMGPGFGQASGGKAKENDTAQTGFTSEKSPSQLTAGQTMLEWKTKGPSESGVAVERYQQAVRAARQEASEALLTEDLPPSYQQTVKAYFDGLGK